MRTAKEAKQIYTTLSVQEVVAHKTKSVFYFPPITFTISFIILKLFSESKVMCGAFTALRGATLNITCA